MDLWSGFLPRLQTHIDRNSSTLIALAECATVTRMQGCESDTTVYCAVSDCVDMNTKFENRSGNVCTAATRGRSMSVTIGHISSTTGLIRDYLVHHRKNGVCVFGLSPREVRRLDIVYDLPRGMHVDLNTGDLVDARNPKRSHYVRHAMFVWFFSSPNVFMAGVAMTGHVFLCDKLQAVYQRIEKVFVTAGRYGEWHLHSRLRYTPSMEYGCFGGKGLPRSTEWSIHVTKLNHIMDQV